MMLPPPVWQPAQLRSKVAAASLASAAGAASRAAAAAAAARPRSGAAGRRPSPPARACTASRAGRLLAAAAAHALRCAMRPRRADACGAPAHAIGVCGHEEGVCEARENSWGRTEAVCDLMAMPCCMLVGGGGEAAPAGPSDAWHTPHCAPTPRLPASQGGALGYMAPSELTGEAGRRKPSRGQHERVLLTGKRARCEKKTARAAMIKKLVVVVGVERGRGPQQAWQRRGGARHGHGGGHEGRLAHCRGGRGSGIVDSHSTAAKSKGAPTW